MHPRARPGRASRSRDSFRTRYRVRFATATEWVARLAEAKRDGRLEDELAALGRIPLLIVDEVGCAPRGAI